MGRSVWAKSSLLRCAFNSHRGRYFEVFDPYREPWSESLDREVSRFGEGWFVLFNRFLGQWALVFINPWSCKMSITGYYDHEGEIMHDVRKGRWMRDNNKLDSAFPDLAPTGAGIMDPEVQEDIEKQVHDAGVSQGVIERTPSVVL